MIVSLDDHRECEPLFVLQVLRHPNGSLIVGPTDAFDAWFAETPGQTNVERMLSIAALMPDITSAVERAAHEMRRDGEERP